MKQKIKEYKEGGFQLYEPNEAVDVNKPKFRLKIPVWAWICLAVIFVKGFLGV